MCSHCPGKCVIFLTHQAKFDTMKKQMESMEMEVMEARLIRASELNGEMEDDDTGHTHVANLSCALHTLATTK